MPGMICSFHADEWSRGTRVGDGAYRYSWERVDVLRDPGQQPGAAGDPCQLYAR